MSYVQALSQALVHLNALDHVKALAFLPSFVAIVGEFLSAKNESVRRAVSSALRNLFGLCVTSTDFDQQPTASEERKNGSLELEDIMGLEGLSLGDARGLSSAERLVINLRHLLKPRFADAYTEVLKSIDFFV